MSRSLPGALIAVIAAGVMGLAWCAMILTGDASPPRAASRTKGTEEAPQVALLPPAAPVTAAEVREVVQAARTAPRSAAASLRDRALTSPDPLVVGNALRALGAQNLVVRDPALVSLLDDRRPRVRQEVVIALGQSGDPAAVELLAPRLASDDDMLRSLVIQALGRLPGEQAHTLVTSIADDPSASSTDRAFASAAAGSR
jgi:hypothetical protein